MSNSPKSLAKLNFKLTPFPGEEVTEFQLKEGIDNDYLFVLLHGWTNKAEKLSSLAQMILDQKQFKKSTILIPELSIKFFSTSKPEIIASDIVWLSCSLCDQFNLYRSN